MTAVFHRWPVGIDQFWTVVDWMVDFEWWGWLASTKVGRVATIHRTQCMPLSGQLTTHIEAVIQTGTIVLVAIHRHFSSRYPGVGSVTMQSTARLLVEAYDAASQTLCDGAGFPFVGETEYRNLGRSVKTRAGVSHTESRDMQYPSCFETSRTSVRCAHMCLVMQGTLRGVSRKRTKRLKRLARFRADVAVLEISDACGGERVYHKGPVEDLRPPVDTRARGASSSRRSKLSTRRSIWSIRVLVTEPNLSKFPEENSLSTMARVSGKEVVTLCKTCASQHVLSDIPVGKLLSKAAAKWRKAGMLCPVTTSTEQANISMAFTTNGAVLPDDAKGLHMKGFSTTSVSSPERNIK